MMELKASNYRDKKMAFKENWRIEITVDQPAIAVGFCLALMTNGGGLNYSQSDSMNDNIHIIRRKYRLQRML